MKSLLISVLMAAAPLLAADEVAHKVVEVKYKDVNAFKELIANFGLQVRADQSLKALVLTGPAGTVALAEAAITKLDVQPTQKDVGVLAYLVLASNEPQSGPEPADLTQVIKQMRALFPYKSYQLLDTIWVRTSAGGSKFHSEGLLPANSKLDPNMNMTYGLESGGTWYIDFDQKVMFSDLSLSLAAGPRRFQIRSNVSIREGQKVVIGKTNPAGPDSAVILVVTAKVIE